MLSLSIKNISLKYGSVYDGKRYIEFIVPGDDETKGFSLVSIEDPDFCFLSIRPHNEGIKADRLRDMISTGYCVYQEMLESQGINYICTPVCPHK